MADLMNRSRGSDRRPMTFVGSSGRRFDPVAILPMERMRRLRVDQPVGVSLDGEAEAIECAVSSLLGPVATLRRPGQLRADVRRMLTHGSLGFLVFDYGGAPVALRGVARAVPDSLAIEFVVIDGIQVAERRMAARTALVARVRLTELRCEETERAALDTSTVDLSLGVGVSVLSRNSERPRRVEIGWCVSIWLELDCHGGGGRAWTFKLTEIP